MIEVRKGFKLQVALDAISRTRTLNSDGSMSIPNFTALDYWESYLASAMYAEAKSEAFIRKVIAKAIKTTQDLAADQFTKDARRIANRLEQIEEKDFKVLFPIWGNSGLLNGKRKHGNVWLNFNFSAGSRFVARAKLERAKQISKDDFSHDLPGYTFPDLPLAVASVKAIDCEDAFLLADDAISIELGLVSILTGRGQNIIPKNPRTPVGTTLAAPQITVHRPSGNLATEIFWYDGWSMRTKCRDLGKGDMSKVKAKADKIRHSVRKLPWRQKAEEVLRRHYRTFRNTDPQVAFLDAWRMLELIAGPGFCRNDVLVDRVSSFFMENDQMQQLGRHLTHRRNSISHGTPIKADDDESMVFQVRMLIRPMLMHFLTNPFGFRELEELWAFADLDSERSKRERKEYLLECAAKFRKER